MEVNFTIPFNMGDIVYAIDTYTTKQGDKYYTITKATIINFLFDSKDFKNIEVCLMTDGKEWGDTIHINEISKQLAPILSTLITTLKNNLKDDTSKSNSRQ